MAAKKNQVEAATFKQTVNTNFQMDRKIEKKLIRLVPRELKFSHSTPNLNPKLLNPLELTSGRIIKPSRMLIYEDSSEEDEAFSRSTPPNIQDRKKLGTPGAPIKTRKEFEKKVLRPKKLVYNDKQLGTIADHRSAEDFEKENQSYQMTPKKSGKNDEDGADFYYEKFLNITAIVPRKIIPIIIREEDSYNSNDREFSAAANTSSRISAQEDRSKARNEGSRKKSGVNGSRKSNRSRMMKNDLTFNKENNAVQFGTEGDLGSGETSFESSKNHGSVKSDRNREEFMGLNNKMGELTHFRI